LVRGGNLKCAIHVFGEQVGGVGGFGDVYAEAIILLWMSGFNGFFISAD
jgi:hypothetical protein